MLLKTFYTSVRVGLLFLLFGIHPARQAVPASGASLIHDRILLNANLFFKPARRLWTYRVLPPVYFRQSARYRCNEEAVPAVSNGSYSTEQKLEHDMRLPALDIEACGRTTSVPRIVQGQIANRNNWRFMVLLVYKEGGKNMPLCGGTVISDRFILSAAHCLTLHHGPREDLRAIVGEYDIRVKNDPHRQEMRIESMHIHPGYEPHKLEQNDIALLKTAGMIKFDSSVGPVCLPPIARRTDFFDEQGLVAGWGATANTSGSSVLLRAWVPIIADGDCWKQLKRQEKFYEGYLCAGGNDGSDSCNGDSGGPLVIIDRRTLRIVQIGVVSFSFSPTCGTGLAAVYTRLDRYTSWIIETTFA